MIKKFSIVFSLTLISQLISLFAISFVVKRNASDLFIKNIALLDSSYVLITTIISFGIIQIASREIVINKNWEKVVEKTQNTRLNLSYLLFAIGLLSYFITKKNYFLTFLFSPLIALNVNYFFYAKGKSQIAARNSSIRIIILSLTLICFGVFQFFSISIYLISFIIGLSYIAIESNSLLKSKINFKINLYFYKEYSKNIGVGVTDLAIIFLEFGILFFASFFYNDTFLSEAYLIIKIITLLKGFQRMIFQVFYDQLLDKEKVYFLDQIILFVGFSFLSISFYFSEDILMLLFSKNNIVLKNNLILYSFAVFIASIILSAMARTLILKNDKTYVRSYFLSLVFSFLTMVLLSYTNLNKYGISIALLVGEVVLFFSFFIDIWKDIFFKKKLINILKFSFLFFAYYITSIFFKQSVLFLFIVISLLIIVVFFAKYNKATLLK